MRLDLTTAKELLNGYHYDRRKLVYEFLAGARQEDFVRPVRVGWQSIRNTLVHCLEAEEFWVQHAVLGKARPSFDCDAYPDVASVARLAAEVRSRTENWVAGLTEADLDKEYTITYSSGTQNRFTLSKLLLHVITHDTHHRGQVMALARQMGYEPPEIDLM